MNKWLGVLVVLAALSWPAVSYAAEFQAEVMALEGQSYKVTPSGAKTSLNEGDVLSAGDQIEVGTEGSVDLAFDSDWQNVSHIEAGSSVKIVEIYPTKMTLEK